MAQLHRKRRVVLSNKVRILQIVPDEFKAQMENAFTLIGKLVTRPSKNKIALALYRAGVTIRAWRSQSKGTRGFPSKLDLPDSATTTTTTTDLKSVINDLADKVAEAFNEAKQDKEDEISSSVKPVWCDYFENAVKVDVLFVSSYIDEFSQGSGRRRAPNPS